MCGFPRFCMFSHGYTHGGSGNSGVGASMALVASTAPADCAISETSTAAAADDDSLPPGPPALSVVSRRVT